MTDHPLYANVLSYPADTIGLAYETLADHPEYKTAAELAEEVKTRHRRCQHGRWRTASLADQNIERRFKLPKRQPTVYALPACKASLVVKVWDGLGDSLASAICQGYNVRDAAREASLTMRGAEGRVYRTRQKIQKTV